MQSPADAEPAVGAKVKPKRTYRACQPCRARKLKCDLGDPDNPSEPPCKRCRRESRECVFVQRANAKTYLEPSPSSGNPSLPLTTVVPQRPNKARKSAHSVSQVDAAPGPSAARAAAHPYAQSPAAGWGPSPGSSNGRANSATPGESNGPRGQYFLPSVAASGAANHASPYDPNFPLIPHLPLHTTNAVASTSHLEHDSTFPPQNPPPPPATGASSSLQQHSAAQKQQGSPPPQHAMQSDGEDGDERASDEDDDMEDDDGESGSVAGSSRGRGGGRGRGEAPSSLLLSSTLHNPSDALKLLATASSLRSLSTDLASRAAQEGRGRGDGHGNGEEGRGGAAGGSSGPFVATGKTGLGLGAATTARGKSKERRVEKEDEVPQAAGWERWTPVVEGMVTVTEAEVLLSFFQEHMSPLYPLLSPRIFTAAHLSSLTSRESLLLAAMICISARYSSLPSPARALRIHHEVSDYINGELIGLLDGSGELRHISSVEALLLLTEWPPIADSRARRGRTATARGRGWRGSEAQTVQVDENDGDGPKAENLVEDAEALLKTSARYDSMSWSFIGCAVRLAQELGIHNLWFGKEHGVTWHEERCLRTWIYCYNADRHVSVRLGRNAVIQAYMSSSWWEQVTSRASQDVRGEGLSEVWAERTLPQGLIAALMGTIQERLYPNKEITRSMIRSGHWESFIRSLEHELQMMQLKSRIVLQAGNIESTLLEMEFMYTRLYGNAIALRALQERLRRAVKAHDLWFVSPSLLNLQEGQWVLDALSAAQSILDKTCNYLAPKGYLRVAPSRIFQRILFASTFLFKALAVGVVEHGQSKVMDLLDQTITVLHTQAVDRQHIAHGFAALLRRLQAQCKPTLLSRFGVRPAVSGVEAGTTPAPSGPGTPAAPPHHAPSPFPRQAPQLPAMPPRTTATATTSNQQSDPLLAPTPGPSLPGSASATPRNGFNPLPPLHEDNTGGMLPSPSFPHPQGYPSAATAAGLNFYNPAGFAGGPLPPGIPPYGAQPSWYGAMPEPTNELGAFQLGGVPAGYDLGNPFEWDPTASNIAVGKEQDLLFQSLWGGSGVLGGIGESGGGVNPALNLFGTLGLTGGDEFGLE